MPVCTSFLEQICIAIHPTLWESGFAGAGHSVRQLTKKERIFRSKLERRGPPPPLNLVERLSALLKSGILAELQLLSFLNPAKSKTKQKKSPPKTYTAKAVINKIMASLDTGVWAQHKNQSLLDWCHECYLPLCPLFKAVTFLRRLLTAFENHLAFDAFQWWFCSMKPIILEREGKFFVIYRSVYILFPKQP